jgi:hypothetical protein
MSAGPVLHELFAEYGDRIAFLTVYVREAHPGENFPQPWTIVQKMAHARAYQERDMIPWRVAVDDVAGTFHREMDSKMNAAYLVNEHGIVVARVLSAASRRAMRRALDHFLATHKTQRQRSPRLGPLLRSVRTTKLALALAGPSAKRDMLRFAAKGLLAARRP